MGKIKSAIITAILVAGLIVLAFFATVSYPVAGKNGVEKHNSFISKISLGSDLTGDATIVLYPEGVISAADYTFGIPDDDDDKRDEYLEKYKSFGSVYVDADVLLDDENAVQLKNSVKHDAEILSKRLGEKKYSSYSVAVRDDLTIVVTVPTNYSYADYADPEYTAKENPASDKQTAITNAVRYLAYGGELTLRNSEVGKGPENILGDYTVDATSYFKSFKPFSRAGNYAVKVNLTGAGKEFFKKWSKEIVDNASSDKAVGFYVGDNQLLGLNLEESISGNSFYITVDSKQTAISYAAVFNSCLKGETLTLNYGTTNDIDVVYTSATLGDNAAIYLFCAVLAILLAAIVYSIVRYRLLGFVNAIIILTYALTIVVALMLINIQLTIAGAIFAIAGLSLLVGANFVVFEKARKETEKGKTIQSAIKSAYKSLWKGILELHVVLIAVSLIVALVCVGELAACGLIFFIGSIASYLLYWFTRFLWFTVSSTVRDKFAFCGFKREELEDD